MKATNPSRNGSKSSSNEESIKSTATASKDDSECSEAFGSNVEQAPSEKVDSEEGILYITNTTVGVWGDIHRSTLHVL